MLRTRNCLSSVGVRTIGELVQWDETSLLAIRSFGKTCLNEMKRALANIGLSLNTTAVPIQTSECKKA